jgi:hypothetical protein
MSGHGFHVHGPHDHELEHAAQGGHGGDGHTNSIAMAAIALLSRKKCLEYEIYGAGAGGVVVGVLAYLHI